MQKAHSYRLDRLGKGQDLEARQLLETWLAVRLNIHVLIVVVVWGSQSRCS